MIVAVVCLQEGLRFDTVVYFSRFLRECWVLVKAVQMIVAVVCLPVETIRFHTVYGIIFPSSFRIYDFSKALHACQMTVTFVLRIMNEFFVA